MAPVIDFNPSSNDEAYTPEERNTPPAFLDLADSGGRGGAQPNELNAIIQIKRLEHERQRAIQRSKFEEQMRLLEQQQAIEERELLLVPPGEALATSMQHMALSAPTTPPRAPSVGPLDVNSYSGIFDLAAISAHSRLSNADKRKSVTYASPEVMDGVSPGNYGLRQAGAKSMPGSRRGSSGSKDGEDLLSLQALRLHDQAIRKVSSPKPILRQSRTSLYGESGLSGGDGHGLGHYNAAFVLDDELDKEMHNSIKFLPNQSDEEKGVTPYSNKLSAASVALDLAPLSQTPPRNSFMSRQTEAGGKSSEWPQFSGNNRSSDINGKRVVTNSAAIGDKLSALSANSTPHLSQHSPGDTSRRSSPPGLTESLSSVQTINSRSVPATPMTNLPRAEIPNLTKTPGTPRSPHPGQDINQFGRGDLQMPENQRQFSAPDLSATLQRLGSQYESPITFGSIQHSPDDPSQYGDYNLNSNMDINRYSGGYNYDSSRSASGAGSTALYHHHGSRYGLGIGGGRAVGQDSKMNGLHGPKHKRGDMDREFNRFAGTRLEDLQGEIPSLCKDQHGCRYLQKKLEEGVPDHRDMIFRETFGHFADLMTDPFGNYLCQKLLEYSTDEQRNVICESVAQDLVTISLNMHGTRAVQKMIDFLSTQRQTDLRYDAQIHLIIRALSMHVVTLIKDLNGNHVIQKCLNRLVPEDNQFIYNAVAAHCVEVATHRHGCCVLQRCIDHASDSQRMQLVTEITYNALTLVQDPYGNYVVQYILDLNDNRFSDAVIRQFIGNVCALSVQKFSSNVIEKCIRVAEHNTRKMLIEELLHRTRLEKLLRDSFGNYCVQTALDYAEPNQRMALVEGIRPILPLIRNTPYGKRIQSKLQREQMEAASNGHYGGGPYHQQAHTAALVNLALANNGMNMGGGATRHLPQQSLQHSNPLGDAYNRSSPYSLSPNGLGGLHPQHSGSPQLHNPQLHGLHHSTMDGYVLQGGGGGNPNVGGGGLGGYGNYSSALGGGFGANVGLGASMADPYQRSSFPYAM